MSRGLKLRTQRAVIVDLAVEDDPARFVFVGDRLVPALDVDDAETTHAERGPAADQVTGIVRSSVRHGIAHDTDAVCVPDHRDPADDGSDAAHLVRSGTSCCAGGA